MEVVVESTKEAINIGPPVGFCPSVVYLMRKNLVS